MNNNGLTETANYVFERKHPNIHLNYEGTLRLTEAGANAIIEGSDSISMRRAEPTDIRVDQLVLKNNPNVVLIEFKDTNQSFFVQGSADHIAKEMLTNGITALPHDKPAPLTPENLTGALTAIVKNDPHGFYR